MSKILRVNWKMVKLGEVTIIKTGKLDANASSENGEYPFFTCSREPLKIDAYTYDCECVLVAGNGDLNVKYYNGKFDAYQRTYIVESIDKNTLHVPYLFLFLDGYLETLREQSIGGVIKYIKLGNLTEAEIPLLALDEQIKIAAELDKITDLIAKRKTQLEKLDLIVKAKFVEMFGDQYPKIKASAVCEFITKGTTPKSTEILEEFEDNCIPFLKVYNLSFDGRLLFKENPQYISRVTHEGFLSRSKVYPNDVLMNIVGPPLGKFTLVPNDFCEYNINQAMAIFRAKNDIQPIYLLHALMQPETLKPFLQFAVGVRQQNLSLQQCRDLEIPLPPLTLQTQFAGYVQKVEKTKATIQKSLEKLETLKKARMQFYFE